MVEFCSFSASSLCCRATICLERSSGVLQNKTDTFNRSVIERLHSIYDYEKGLTKSRSRNFTSQSYPVPEDDRVASWPTYIKAGLKPLVYAVITIQFTASQCSLEPINQLENRRIRKKNKKFSKAGAQCKYPYLTREVYIATIWFQPGFITFYLQEADLTLFSLSSK